MLAVLHDPEGKCTQGSTCVQMLLENRGGKREPCCHAC
jgi:hypothetical protein